MIFNPEGYLYGLFSDMMFVNTSMAMCFDGVTGSTFLVVLTAVSYTWYLIPLMHRMLL